MFNLIVTVWFGIWFLYQVFFGNVLLGWAALAVWYILHLLGRILRAVETNKTELIK